jgi:hypothetical protein
VDAPLSAFSGVPKMSDERPIEQVSGHNGQVTFLHRFFAFCCAIASGFIVFFVGFFSIFLTLGPIIGLLMGTPLSIIAGIWSGKNIYKSSLDDKRKKLTTSNKPELTKTEIAPYSSAFDDRPRSYIDGRYSTEDFKTRSLKMTVFIAYEDSKGERTQRTVDIQQFDCKIFSGFCSLRQRFRTFRYDSLLEVTERETGEVQHPTQFYSYLCDKYKNSPEYKHLKWLEEEGYGLKAAYAIAKADNRFTKGERGLLTNWLSKKMGGFGSVTEKQLRDTIDKLEMPRPCALSQICKKLATLPETQKNDIKNLAQAIHQSKKTHKEEELAVFKQVIEALQ